MNLKRRDFLKAGSLGAGGLMLTQFVNQLEAAPKAKPARALFFAGQWRVLRDVQPGMSFKTPSKLEGRPLDRHAMSLSRSHWRRG